MAVGTGMCAPHVECRALSRIAAQKQPFELVSRPSKGLHRSGGEQMMVDIGTYAEQKEQVMNMP